VDLGELLETFPATLPAPSPPVEESSSRPSAVPVKAVGSRGNGRGAGKTRRGASPPKDSSLARMNRRAADWTPMCALDRHEYESAQLSNVRRRSTTRFKKRRWTVDRVLSGVSGAPPEAMRWYDPGTNEFTMTQLKQVRKRGTSRMRLVVRNERVVHDRDEADRLWSDLVGQHLERSLRGDAAAQHVFEQVVSQNYGCVWRETD